MRMRCEPGAQLHIGNKNQETKLMGRTICRLILAAVAVANKTCRKICQFENVEVIPSKNQLNHDNSFE